MEPSTRTTSSVIYHGNKRKQTAQFKMMRSISTHLVGRLIPIWPILIPFSSAIFEEEKTSLFHLILQSGFPMIFDETTKKKAEMSGIPFLLISWNNALLRQGGWATTRHQLPPRMNSVGGPMPSGEHQLSQNEKRGFRRCTIYNLAHSGSHLKNLSKLQAKGRLISRQKLRCGKIFIQGGHTCAKIKTTVDTLWVWPWFCSCFRKEHIAHCIGQCSHLSYTVCVTLFCCSAFPVIKWFSFAIFHCFKWFFRCKYSLYRAAFHLLLAVKNFRRPQWLRHSITVFMLIYTSKNATIR